MEDVWDCVKVGFISRFGLLFQWKREARFDDRGSWFKLQFVADGTSPGFPSTRPTTPIHPTEHCRRYQSRSINPSLWIENAHRLFPHTAIAVSALSCKAHPNSHFALPWRLALPLSITIISGAWRVLPGPRGDSFVSQSSSVSASQSQGDRSPNVDPHSPRSGPCW